MDSAEAHRQLGQVTGAPPPRPGQLAERPLGERLVSMGVVPAANAMAQSFRGVLEALQTFVADVTGLLDVLEDLVDDDGREIWLRAGEVELDQFVAHVIEERDAVRRSLRGVVDPS